jgi:MFS family permease
MCQQITGINTVIYYAPTIFQSAGFTSVNGAILATVGIGGINVIATIISAWLLDRAGRRFFLLLGVGGMVVSLAVLSLAFFMQSAAIDKISVGSLLAYVAFFAIGLGPVTFVLISEIYPLRIRAKAMTLAMFVNWFFNYWVSLTFLDLVGWLGQAGTFLLFTLISLASFLFILRWIPETKNRTLEEIEKELT